MNNKKYILLIRKQIQSLELETEASVDDPQFAFTNNSGVPKVSSKVCPGRTSVETFAK